MIARNKVFSREILLFVWGVCMCVCVDGMMLNWQGKGLGMIWRCRYHTVLCNTVVLNAL